MKSEELGYLMIVERGLKFKGLQVILRYNSEAKMGSESRTSSTNIPGAPRYSIIKQSCQDMSKIGGVQAVTALHSISKRNERPNSGESRMGKEKQL